MNNNNTIKITAVTDIIFLKKLSKLILFCLSFYAIKIYFPDLIILLYILSKIICITIFLLISVALFTVAERKLMGSVQRRQGPNEVGFWGILQAFSDGLKLFSKETTIPSNANSIIFLTAPVISFSLSLIGWAVIPFSHESVLSDVNLGSLYIAAISSLNVYGIILAGWASNSKYAYLGALRSASQMVSYEIPLGLILLTISACVGSLNLSSIVLIQQKVWLVGPLFPLFFVFLVSMLAETNRHPFDLPEAETELVSGYNVEYSAMAFALFFLAEYANMLLMCFLVAIFFMGGWMPFVKKEWIGNYFPQEFWFSLKIVAGVWFFIITRATLPRYRYDQLMTLGWKVFLPLTLGYFIFTIGILISFNWLPH